MKDKFYFREYYAKNAKRCREKSRRWRQKPQNRAKIRQLHRVMNYRKRGITEVEYEQRLLDQDGRCAICHDDECLTLVIDHCHRRKQIRGLLCDNCNKGLGHFRDTIYFLRQAIRYLGPQPA